MKLVLFLLLAACSTAPKKVVESPMIQPNIIKEVTEGLMHPESVIFSAKDNSLYVSNVASGNPLETKAVGYISKYTFDGKLIKAKWLTGLHAPKGMAIVGDSLYVTDVTRVHKISLSNARILKTFKVAGSKFLNDAVADAQGNVYISDMQTDSLHIIKNDKMSIWLKDAKLENSNGLFTDGKEHLLVVKWGTDVDWATFVSKTAGHMAMIPFTNSANIQLHEGIQGNLDGIAADKNGVLWISDWMNGDVYSMEKNGKAQKMFNMGQGTADLMVIKESNLLVIPQMNQSKLIFIQL